MKKEILIIFLTLVNKFPGKTPLKRNLIYLQPKTGIFLNRGILQTKIIYFMGRGKKTSVQTSKVAYLSSPVELLGDGFKPLLSCSIPVIQVNKCVILCHNKLNIQLNLHT